MTSLSVYALIFFKALSGIICYNKSILNNFFFVGGEGRKPLGLDGKQFACVRSTRGWGCDN
jgi:hypothetical protein